MTERERVRILERIAKYAREDRAVTPGFTRLARALDDLDRAFPAMDRCAACRGSGRVTRGDGTAMYTEQCGECHGNGQVPRRLEASR